MKSGGALLLGFLLLATTVLVVESETVLDPLAPFRTPDGRLNIPGHALTPELQRLLFHRNELQPYLHFSYPIVERSAYPTAHVIPVSFDAPNLNVFVHSTSGSEPASPALARLVREWFPPVNWQAVADGIKASVGASIGWFFNLFTVNARADTLSVDSTTVTLVEPAASTCTTSQTATAGDNGILVMLSNRPATSYATVTYGSVSLSLIPSTDSSGTGIVRTEMWFYQGLIPVGAQTMTATLSSGTAKHICATVLLRGVSGSTPTTGGTTASAISTNPNIAISPAAGELAFAVLAIRGTTAPTAVTGTGAAATSLYGIAPTQCTAAGTNLCGAGAYMPNPGTAITWTDGNSTDWVVGAVRVVPAPNCGAAGGNCYRIGNGMSWNTASRWSNTSGGASCACVPAATNHAIFDANPTGTTSLAAATTIASIDMTGFTGTLDTTGSNWALTVNGAFNIQGTFLARNSTVTVTGAVAILTAATIVDLGASAWTVNGAWTNLSTSASWVAGTSTITIRDASSVALRFAALAGGTNEFSNLTLDATVTTSITYTMTTNPLRMGATLTIRNSTGGAVGSTILTTSGSNLGITVGALTIATFGSLEANGSTIAINGNVNVSGANGYLVMGSSTWTVSGTWTNASTSASWSAGIGGVTFSGATGGAMTFAGTNLPGNEFNNVTFTSSAASAQTFTMATRALIWGGALTVSDGSGTTALATANLGLTGGALNVGNGGILTANASTIAVSNVTMTGGTSGTITLTSSSFTSTGDWNTSGAGSVFTKGTSTVTMSGAGNIAILNAGNNFYNLIISAAGTVTQTGLVDVAGTLTVSAGAVLASSTFTLTVATLAANMAGGITAGAAGTKTITGNVSIAAAGFFSFGGATWNFGGSWTNSSTNGSWSAGTGTVIFNSGASRTMTFADLGVQEFNNVQFSPTAAATFTMATNGLRWAATLTLDNNATLATASLALNGTGGNLTVNNGATLVAGTSAVSVTNVTMTGGTSGTITASGAWAVAGNWDTSGVGSVFSGTSSTVTMSGAARTVRILNASNGFDALSISGTVSAASAITVAGLLTVTGTFDTTGSNYGITVSGDLTVSGATGILRTNASTISVAGNVMVNDASGYITSAGGGSWTVSGSWTNASTSASWSFLASMTFDSTASRTMTFAILPGSAAEFNDVTFNSGASTVTFSLATAPLIWAGTLTVQGGSGMTTLVTNDLGLTGGAIVVGNGGVLTATASAVSVSNVTMTGGASGTLTLTTGTWTVTGNWDSSGIGSTLIAGSSTITFTGSSTTIALAAGQMFYDLTIAGTVSASSTLAAGGTLTLNNGAVLTKTGQSLAFNALTMNGTGSIAEGAISVVNFSVSNSDPSNLTTIGAFTSWSVDTEYTWTHSSTVPTSTITFTIGGNTIGYRFNVTKDGVDFANGLVNGSGQVILTMLGSDPLVDVLISSPCGGSRYWIGGTGNWSQTVHWADTSGGANGCSVPTALNPVFFDASSGGGTVTVNLNAMVSSLNTSGWTGTVAIGTFDLTVSGDIVHAAGILSIGASSNTGLTATGTLTLSGSASLDGSGAPSLVRISGDTSITSASAYLRMGSGTWAFSGSWFNGSTSTNWSAGTGTVIFDSSSSRTMTFAGTNLSGVEFNTVVFNGGSSTVTFTMASRGLATNTIKIQGGPGTTTLSTSGSSFAISANTLTVESGGALAANGSVITLRSMNTVAGAFASGTSTVVVNTSGGSINVPQGLFNLSVNPGIATSVSSNVTWSGTLTLTGATVVFGGNLSSNGPAALIFGSSTISIAGSWNTSSAIAFTSTGSSVTFAGTSGSITLGAGHRFDAVTIAGTVALASDFTATSLTVGGSGTLTMTGHSIAFNTLTVSGAIMDGSVTVSDLTVTNSEPTALVTITLFSAWSAGSSYGWTHSSNETSQTISWTIGGNIAALPFSVTKDGAPFASGTVDGTGQVVFTMLGSDPDMLVTVSAPVAPPTGGGWWQTSYWFVILPTGIFLGVAMFAQRQRWRPAKAFLVDERGKMLREFTLDPSCQVTYDQAVDAGILDAVDKPIKVAKYRGQTVRGDALAVVLLAYGPISLEQVEFAREILVQVQDKFEDAVKQRLEEARARDAELDGRAKQLEEQRQEIDARSTELDARQVQIEAAQSNISQERAAVTSKEEDLVRRETQIAEERKAIDELAERTETLSTDLNARTAQLRTEAAEVAERSNAIRTREDAVGGVEAKLQERDQSISQVEARLAAEQGRIAAEASTLQGRIQEVDDRELAVRKDLEGLAQSRDRFEGEQKDLLEFKRSVDTRVAEVQASEAAAVERTRELDAREARLAPFETELASREAVVASAEEEYQSRKEQIEGSLAEIAERAQSLEVRETGLKEDRIVLEEARVAFDSERREFQDRTAHFEDEIRRRHADLDAQAKGIGEQQERHAQEKETFEASRNEKNQAMLAREIEVEAREQSLIEKEEAVRSQAEENARRLGELAAREEAAEIEGARLDKVRGELDTRKGELANLATELDGRAARLREEEAQRAEELRTWQATLESQQALLKEQRETFENESVSQRESWATRVMRVERREIEVRDQEEEVREEVSVLRRNQEDLARREQTAQDALQSASRLKEQAERLRSEVEQYSLEVDSRDRALREEAARHAKELAERTATLDALEAEINARRNELETDRVAQTQRIHQMDADLQANTQTLEAKARELAERESRAAAMEESLRATETRLEQERAAVQATGEQLEAHQLELSQLKDRYESESARVRTEAERMGQTFAVKEAEMRAERERIERDASTLQETLGGKAKEMAIREKALSAREGELRAEEEDVEARTRELESKERQVEARLTELSAQAMALVRREQDLNARDGQFEQTARKFHAEESEKRKQWESLQTALRSQQAQLNATTESRAAEMTKRADELEGRERTFRAAASQLELERSKLESQAKAHAAKTAEAEAAWQRSETRLAELKAKEDELLRARQSFESERSVWSAKRAEELKQLEATRDAAAVHSQQAEKLGAESQRRTLVAEEAEKAAKRQTAELQAEQTNLERRRSDAEKAQRSAQEQIAQLQEASRKLAAKETEIGAATRDLDLRQTRLAASEKETAAALTDVRTRKGTLDQESTRLSSLSTQLTGRQKDLESRASILETKVAEVTAKEHKLGTELQRADNLMEDLARKDRDLHTRAEATKALEMELAKRDAALTARDAQLSEGQRSLDKMRQEIETQHNRAADDLQTASAARADAEKLRVQADAMQAEVSKNLRFLQKKALDVLDREEKLREREVNIDHKERALDTRAEILEGKERAMDADQSEIESRTSKLQAEMDRLRTRLAEIERAGGPTTTAMEEWKRDVESRVKIIQKKAMDLLDREQKLREKEEELRALAQQLGVAPVSH